MDSVIRITLLLSFIILLDTGINPIGVGGEFVVNARTKAGNVVRLSIKENIQDSYVALSYEDWDLTKITQLVDYKSGFNIYKVVLFGEIDSGQPLTQTLCFISHLSKTDFIEPESVSKLRQRNQDAIRSFETDLGVVMNKVDLSINLMESDVISPHIVRLCHDSDGAIYSTGEHFLKTAEVYDRNLAQMKSATQRLTTYQLNLCQHTKSKHQACICQYQFAIDWYPCSLRYCKTADSTFYKCGIKTCGITHSYEFAVDSNTKCWWKWFEPS